MKDWRHYLTHGREYYEAARNGYGDPGKFNTDTLFNLAAMSIETTSMALMMKNNVLPEGHSFCDLAAGIKTLTVLPHDLEEEMKRLDSFQMQYCSLDILRPEPITRESIPPILETCCRLQDFVNEALKEEAVS